MAEKGSLAFIPSTICPEANSKVKCENENPLATEATRSKSDRVCEEACSRVNGDNFPIAGGVQKNWAEITIIVIIVCAVRSSEKMAVLLEASSFEFRAITSFVGPRQSSSPP
jgi:hypothetical protein